MGIKFPPYPTSLLLLLALITVALVPSAARPADDDAEQPAVRRQIATLLAAWGHKDVPGMLAVWSPQAKQSADFRRAQEAFFSGAEQIKTGEPDLGRWLIKDGKGVVRVRCLRTWTSFRTGESQTEPMVWDTYWEKEAGEWRLWEFADVVSVRSIAVYRAGSREEREKALRADPDAAVATMVHQFRGVAEAFTQQGDFDFAFRANDAERAVAELLGDGAEVAWSYATRASIHHARTAYPEAEADWRRAEADLRKSGDLSGAALVRSNVGAALEAQGKYAEALPLLDSSVKDLQGTDRPSRLVNAEMNRGIVLFRLGRYRESEASLRTAYDLAEKQGYLWGRVLALTNLANLENATAQYEAALRDYQACREIARQRKMVGEELRLTNNIGLVLAAQGDPRQAVSVYTDGLALARKAGDRGVEALLATNLGSAYQLLGQYGEALAQLDAGLSAFRAQKARAQEAATLVNMGVLYNLTGKYDESLRAHQQALALAKEVGDRRNEMSALMGIALYHMHRGDGKQASETLQASHALANELGDREGQMVALLNLSHMLRQIKDYPAALQLGTQGLKLAQELRDVSREAGALDSLARTQAAAGHPKEAIAGFEAAVKLAVQSGDRELEMNAKRGLGSVYSDEKRWKEAVAAYRQSGELLEGLRADTQEQTLQTSYFAQYSSSYFLLARALRESGAPAEAFAASERARARTLVDVLRRGKASVTRSLSSDEVQEETRLDRQVSTLTAEVQNGRALPTDRLLAMRQELDGARAKYEEYQRGLFTRHRELRTQRGKFVPAGLVVLNGKLFAGHPGLCVLSYLAGENETLLYVLTAGKAPGGPAALAIHRVPVTFKELATEAGQFREACSQDGGDYRAVGQKLYLQLLQPAAAELAGKTHLVIVPDPALPTLPFQALVDPAGKHLAERCSLSYAPSVTALAAMMDLRDARRKETATVPLFAAGRPQYTAYPDLPATEPEVRAIAALAGAGARVYTGAAASESRVRAEIGNARFVHLATHGLINEVAPMYSALALTKGPTDDGLLEARELLGMDLKAEMVVLSACESGLGQGVRGEAVLGLTWALFVAGAPTSVVSQWQVEDTSTGTLMQSFYSRFLRPAKGAPPVARVQALRLAQLQMLRDGKHGHPYYWAPFVLVGDWR